MAYSSPRQTRHASAPDDDPAIVVRDLVKRYDDVTALDGVDLTVERGEIYALLGPNGAGKTTLFSILATLRSPTSGTARVFGLDAAEARHEIRQRIGIVFQQPALDEQLSARDNLQLMGLFYRLSRRESRRRAEEVLERLGMAEYAERPPEKLSGGQKRKLELARAIIAAPQLLFLDEATLGLDVESRRAFWKTVRSLASDGTTVFLTTHYMEEAEIADRIGLISEGRIVAEGSPEALRDRVGGGLVLLDTEDNDAAADWLREQGHDPESSEEGLLLIGENPATMLPPILRGIPQEVRRAEVRQPSLEDAFLKLTGRSLDGETP